MWLKHVYMTTIIQKVNSFLTKGQPMYYLYIIIKGLRIPINCLPSLLKA